MELMNCQCACTTARRDSITRYVTLSWYLPVNTSMSNSIGNIIVVILVNIHCLNIQYL